MLKEILERTNNITLYEELRFFHVLDKKEGKAGWELHLFWSYLKEWTTKPQVTLTIKAPELIDALNKLAIKLEVKPRSPGPQERKLLEMITKMSSKGDGFGVCSHSEYWLGFGYYRDRVFYERVEGNSFADAIENSYKKWQVQRISQEFPILERLLYLA
jgi:hypothetical protein